MAGRSVTNTSRLARANFLAKLGIALVALVWSARYAYVRTTTRPPGTLPYADLIQRLIPRPGNDVGEQLLDAMNSLPARPYPSFEIAVAGTGAWEPAARPELADAIRYLELPETRQTLEAVAAISGGQCGVDGTFGQHGAAASAAEHFVCRARYRWEGQRDYAAAQRDLLTALNLARMFCEQPMVWSARTAAAIETAACEEIRRMAADERVPIEQVTALREGLASVGLPPVPPLRAALRTSRRFYLASLDGYYVKDGRGRGWLDIEALSRWGRQRRSDRWPATGSLTRLGGAWNLFSPVYRSREVVEAKCARILDSVAAVEGLAGSAAFEQLGVHRRLIEELDALDGVLPLFFGNPEGYEEVVEQLFRGAMERQATAAVLAIEQYRRTNGGEPPPSLDALVPDYLASLPGDWYADAPLRYRVDGEGYTLYSIHRNRTDDGGNHGSGQDWREHPDYVYTANRPDPRYYPVRQMLVERASAVWFDDTSSDATEP